MNVIGKELIYLKEVGSTNGFLINEVYKKRIVDEGVVVVTESQTSGQGYANNFWESEPGMNLTFSVLLRPVFIKANQQFLLNKSISLGVMDYIKSVIPAHNVTIKWPNDIYINDGKVAGILINNLIAGDNFLHSVAGIGININQIKFRNESHNPVSLKQFVHADLDLGENLRNALSFLNFRYEKLANGYFTEIDAHYKASLYRINTKALYKIEDTIFEARITGVSIFGRLQLLKSDGKRLECDLKEIEYII